MRRIALSVLALFLAVLVASPAVALTSIQGPSNVQVPYNQCVQATWSSSSSYLDTYQWSWNSSIVGSSSSYTRTFCSPGLDVYSRSNDTVSLYTTDGGISDYDTKSVTIHYEGRCGIYIWC